MSPNQLQPSLPLLAEPSYLFPLTEECHDVVDLTRLAAGITLRRAELEFVGLPLFFIHDVSDISRISSTIVCHCGLRTIFADIQDEYPAKLPPEVTAKHHAPLVVQEEAVPRISHHETYDVLSNPSNFTSSFL